MESIEPATVPSGREEFIVYPRGQIEPRRVRIRRVLPGAQKTWATIIYALLEPFRQLALGIDNCSHPEGERAPLD